MRREIDLWRRIGTWTNLEAALAQTLRGKRTRRDVQEFLRRLPLSLLEVQDRLIEGRGPIGDFRTFTIYDPKERLIAAPCFPDRVMHHAVINVCEPVFERWLVRQTFACRTGLGLRAAIAEARHWSARRRWYLKMDVRHYFETVPRDQLLSKVERLFGERELLAWWADVILPAGQLAGRGMPIGALTSQHLANFYLGFLDRVIKEELRIKAYVRYMDDLILWHDDKEVLKSARDRVVAFTADELGLVMKPPALNRMNGGMDFVGFRFHSGWVGLNRRSRRRLREKVRGLERAWARGSLSGRELQDRVTAALAFVEPSLTARVLGACSMGDGP
jgi:hypothetical protein